ncbi:unnamed protein product [Owenia fusiformis]|nr:unnamed protein product [Owenia fusiformis]
MISRIMNSVTRCPSVMRLVFQRLMSSVIDKWPEEEWRDHRFLSVSGFLFLRFFAPAVLSPKLFAMRDAHPDARLSRSLTLAAKVIQSIGNLGVQIGPAKEKWMEPLHDFIKLCVPDVKEYLQRVCEVDGKAEHITGLYRRRSTFHPSVIMKEGYLEKYRDGVKSNKSKNLLKIFKQRYFWLKYESLTYTHKSSDQVRNTISTCNIVGVEKVDKNAFGKNHIGQIIYRNSDDDAQYAQGKQGSRSDCKKTAEPFETLYFQAKNVNDLSSWISSIRKTCITNTFLLEYYHPGAFSGNKWTCCLTKLKSADGCCRTHCKATLGDWRDPLDPDVDAQLVYSQLQRAADVFRKKYTETAIEVTEDTQHMSQNSECVSKDTQHVSQETECVSQDNKDMSRETDTTNANISNTENANAESANAENANTSHDVRTNSQRDILLGRSISYKDAQMGAVAELLDVISDLEKIHQIFERKEMEEKRKSIQTS